MELSGETEGKVPHLSTNPEMEVAPFENCAVMPSVFGDGPGTATPFVVSNSPGTHIAGTVHIHHGSLVYKNIKESTALKLRRLKESYFIDTRTAKIGSKRLSELGFILVEGGSLSGKTTVGLQILKIISKHEKYVPVILDRPEDYVHLPPAEKIVVLVDDIFGRTRISPDSVMKWEKVLKDMLELPRKENIFLVVTCERTVLQESRQWNAPDVLFQPKYTIGMESSTYMIRDYEKYFVLCHLVQRQRLKVPDSEVRELSRSIHHAWFYGCCDYLSTHRMNEETFKKFFKQPLQYHVARLQALSERLSVKFAVLVLLMKMGSLPTNQHEIDQLPELLESLQTVQNVLKLSYPLQTHQLLTIMSSLNEYVTQQEGAYVFCHQSVEDAVCFVFGRHSLEQLLLWCPERFLMNHTILASHSVTSENSFVISESHFPIMKRRFIRKLSSQVFAHPLFSVEGFVDDVFDYLSKAISETNLYQWLLLAIENKQRSLVKRLIPLVHADATDTKEKRIHEAFEKACEVGDVSSFHALRKVGAKPCETCFEKACQLQKNQIIVGGILFELSIDFDTLNGNCLNNCIGYLIKVKDQHNLDMILQQLSSRSDYNSLIHKSLKNACSSGSLEFFHHVRDLALSIDVTTLLNYAIEGGNLAIVEWLTDAYSKSDSSNGALGSYFLKACMLKEKTIAELLTNRDPTASQAKTENGDSAVHKASAVPFETAPTVLSWLIQKGLDIQCTNAFGQTPLHIACQAGNVETIKILLDNNADASIQDVNGNTPVHSNLLGPNPSLKILDMLIEHSGDLNTKNHQQNTPLHTICGQKNKSTSIIVAWIIERQTDGIDAENVDGQTPLHLLLLADGSNEALELLLDCNINVNVQNKDGQTALHIVAAKSNADALEMLLNKRCDLLTTDSTGQTALHIAVSLRSEQCAFILLQWLQKKRMNIDTKNSDGRAVIHTASDSPSSLPFFQLLLESNIQLSQQDKNGLTPLHIVCARCTDTNEKKLNLLLTKGAITDTEDENGITPLHTACMSTGPCTIQMIQTLLEYGADSSHHDSRGQTVLHKICNRSCESDAQVLTLLINTTNPNARDSKGDTPLHKACISNGECVTQVMQILIDHGAAIEIQNNEGNDAIDLSFQESRSRFHTLLELVARNACQSRSRYGSDAIRRMMAKGGFSYGSDANGYTILHKLCMVNEQKTHQITDYFLTHGADVCARTRDQKTALHVACMEVGEYTKPILDVLKRRGVDACARDLKGETALHKVAHVCNTYSVPVVCQLGDMGVDPNTRNLNGDTALHVALLSEGDFIKDVARELIALGSDLTSLNYQGKSPADLQVSFQPSDLLYMYCNSINLLDINQISFLVSKGADISFRDTNGDTVLHKLCFNKGENTHANISVLLQAGADVSLVNASNLTPYDVASFSGLSENTLSMIQGWKASTMEHAPTRQADDSFVPVDTEEQTTQISTALLPYGQSTGESSSGTSHPLQDMHDQMDERKEKAKDSIASSLIRGNYDSFVDDIVALGTAELFRGGIKTLLKRDRNK